MKHLLLATLLLLSVTSIRIHNQEEEPEQIKVGGWSDLPLEDIDPEIDQYIREQYPELKDAELVSARVQVVAGSNNRYQYVIDDVHYKVTVWDRPWLHKRQITGLKKIETSKNEKGQTVKKTTTIQIETEPFDNVTKKLF